VRDTTAGAPPFTIPGIEDLEPVGRGGFGTVYRGWQPALRRKVAVKVLDARTGDAASRERFRREGMAMGVLSEHPNVVPVYATGTVGDRAYLVMPFLSDGSLEDRLSRSGPLEPAEVARLGSGLADALAAAHTAGVLHRDVKPANVLRTSYGALQLADFGIARFVDATQTMGGSLTATVAYAAPEVLSGEPATEASDLYSLGATLHAALLGRAPYEARTAEAPVAMAMRVLSDDPPSLREAGVPAGLATVVERAMAKDPRDRYATAEELRDALDSVELGAPPLDETAVSGAQDGVTQVLDVAVAGPSLPPVAVAAPEPPATPQTAYEQPARRRPDRGPLWWLLALAVLAGVVIWSLLGRGGGDGGDSRDEAGQQEVPTTEAAAPSTEATEAPTETTEAPATEQPAQDVEGEPEQDPAEVVPAEPTGSPVEAVRSYYALMDSGAIEEGFARLSPSYQERTGYDSYRGFWQSISRVEVLSAEGEGGTVAARLRYTSDDGTTSTESVTIRLVRDEESGQLLIDDYQVG